MQRIEPMKNNTQQKTQKKNTHEINENAKNEQQSNNNYNKKL